MSAWPVTLAADCIRLTAQVEDQLGPVSFAPEPWQGAELIIDQADRRLLVLGRELLGHPVEGVGIGFFGRRGLGARAGLVGGLLEQRVDQEGFGFLSILRGDGKQLALGVAHRIGFGVRLVLLAIVVHGGDLIGDAGEVDAGLLLG